MSATRDFATSKRPGCWVQPDSWLPSMSAPSSISRSAVSTGWSSTQPSASCVLFVVEPEGSVNHRRILLPVEAAAAVAPEGGTLRVELESGEMAALDEFDMADFREFTEEDAIAPTLSRYLA